jgi:hypothetical protein
VNKSEAETFAKIWNQGGVSILLSDSAIQFATDFSNIVLRNFIDMCREQAELEAKVKSQKIMVEGLENRVY